MKKMTIVSMAALMGAAPLAAEFSLLGFKGFLGADGGWTNTWALTEATVNTESTKSVLALVGGNIGLFVGGLHTFDNHMTLGIEGIASWQAASGSRQGRSQPYFMAYAKQKQTFGINALVGFSCSNMMPFMRMGWSSSRFDSAYFSDYLQGYAAAQTTKSGFFLAVGADLAVTEGVSIGSAFDYTWYGNFSRQTDGTQPVFFKVTPETDRFTMRVKFVF